MSARAGIGYDCHRLVEGRPLVLGGVRVEHPRGLDGHSDADVVCHAVTDALLGAAGLGDIGEHFPDTDPTWKDADSVELLRTSAAMARQAGHAPVNVDVTVLAEEPKLGPLKAQIRANLADACGLAVEAVNVKATRGEGMGFIGRGEGIACLATAAVVDDDADDPLRR